MFELVTVLTSSRIYHKRGKTSDADVLHLEASSSRSGLSHAQFVIMIIYSVFEVLTSHFFTATLNDPFFT